ncbi:MAG: ATP-binding protein [Candidatus Methylacidiphilales bacterium]|nr:ATP-binding protein [Candidatus Methylacidiphilales bacterium]
MPGNIDGPAGMRVFESFQEESKAPASLMVWWTEGGTPQLCHSDFQAALQLGVPRVEFHDAPMAWSSLPQELADYLMLGMVSLQSTTHTAMPVYEVLEPLRAAFSVKVLHKKDPGHSGSWYFFVFNEVTAWLSLQEEVMNARRLESIGALASGVAHDFNNLLMVIRGHAEYISAHVSNSETLAFSLDQIKKACQSGAGLTQSLLGFARKQSLIMQPMNVGQLVSELVDLCRRSYGSRYEVEADGIFTAIPGTTVRHPDLMINGCAAALSHCVLNILNNSRDSMPEGGRIEIHHRLINETIQVSILDHGVGIEPDRLKNIFEPFYTTKAKGAGTGLGLSLALSIMKQHGGDIEVESTPGVGTQVTFIWPKLAAPSQGDSSPKEKEDPEEVQEAPSSQRAFLIDDDEMVLGAVAKLLEASQVQTTCFSSAEKALAEVVSGNLPSMIFVDYTMPGMDGITFMRRLYAELRHFSRSPHLKMVMISGHPPEFFNDFLKEFHGAPIYLLQKPFSAEDITRIIRLPTRRMRRKTTSRVQIGPV